MRAVYNTLPYCHMPPQLIIEMAKHAVFWLNAFRQPNGIGGNQSPRSIIVGTNVSYLRHCKYQFGEYVQTHKEHDNSMMPRTIGALALHPTGNVQGSFYFFSLSTGRVIARSLTNRRGKWPVYRLKFGCEAPKWCPMATFSFDKLQFKKIWGKSAEHCQIPVISNPKIM